MGNNIFDNNDTGNNSTSHESAHKGYYTLSSVINLDDVIIHVIIHESPEWESDYSRNQSSSLITENISIDNNDVNDDP